MLERPVCLIVNPAAGAGKAARLAPAVEQALRGHGLTLRREDTRDLEHARELARAAAGTGEIVLALSGDGLLGALADAVRDVPGAVLGILPGGRGNDLARVLGIPEDAIAACAAFAHGVPRAIDLGVVLEETGDEHGRSYVGIASAGFDSDANRIANEAPAWLGGQVYAYGALRALLFWRPARLEIELDPPGERRSFSGYSVAVANSRAYGGGMNLAPDALLDDGLLEVVIVERVSRLRFLRNLPKVFAGTHVQMPNVHVFRAAEVAIGADRPFVLYADGDPIGELPLRVRAQRGAVQMIVPVDAAAAPFAEPPPPSAAWSASAPGSRSPGGA
jgi:YegS/Rv2252/BmrU family lipid kinase